MLPDMPSRLVLDDQPVALRSRVGSIAPAPYIVEINDVVMTTIEQAPADEVFRRGRDQLDRRYLEGKDIPRVMATSIHPDITGVRHPAGVRSARLAVCSQYFDARRDRGFKRCPVRKHYR